MKKYPNQRKARISITIPLELHKKLKEEKGSMSISQLITTYINNYNKLKKESEDNCEAFHALEKISIKRKKEIDQLKSDLTNIEITHLLKDKNDMIKLKNELDSLKLKYSKLTSQIEILYNLSNINESKFDPLLDLNEDINNYDLYK